MVKWVAIVAVMLLSTSVTAQVRLRAPSAATLPAVCGIGDLAVKTTATAGLYVCTAANMWTLVGSGGAGTPGGSDTQVQFNDATAFGGSAFTYNKTTQTYTMVTKLPNIDASALSPAPVLAGLGAGNLSNGVYSYKLTQLDNDGNETAAGTATANVTVTNAMTNGQVIISQPYTCSTPYSPVYNIYRTAANGSVYKLLDVLNASCLATYTDNIADTALGVNAPSTNTTA